MQILKKFNPKKKLYPKIVTLFVVVGLLPLSILGYFTYDNIHHSLEESSSENLHEIAKHVAIDVEHLVLEKKSNVEFLAKNPIICSENTTKDEKLQVLLVMHKIFRELEDVILIKTDGNYTFETIEEDEEFEKVIAYLESESEEN